MFVIEKGVPIPKGRLGRPAKYRWEALEIGDSFLMEGVTLDGARATARYHSQKLGREFRVGREGDKIRAGRVG